MIMFFTFAGVYVVCFAWFITILLSGPTGVGPTDIDSIGAHILFVVVFGITIPLNVLCVVLASRHKQ